MFSERKYRFLFVDYGIPYLLRDRDYPEGPVGGAAFDNQIFIDELIALGHQVGLMTFHGAAEYLGGLPAFMIVEADIRRIRKNPVTAPLTFYSALRAIKRYRPDYIIKKCADGSTGIVALLARLAGVKYVYCLANDFDADCVGMEIGRLARHLYNYGLSQSDPIFCQNQYQYDIIRARFPSKSIVMLSNWIDVRGANSQINGLSERKYFAWVGRFVREKNMPCLLRLANELPNIEFRIAGVPGDGFDEETSGAVEGLRRCGNVVFVGYQTRPQISALLAGAYALLNTSHIEGFPRTYLEAWVTGTPIVTTREVDPDDIVSKHDLGAVASDHSGLTTAITSLLSRKDYNDLTKRCQRYVKENHDSSVLIQGFVESLKLKDKKVREQACEPESALSKQ
jgi:glycosyltransferase involved in cell wall biosynthesis